MNATAGATVEELTKQLNDELDKRDSKNGERITALTKQIETAQADVTKQLGELHERMRTFSLPGSNEEKHKGEPYSIRKAIASVVHGNPGLAPMEHAMSQELIKTKTMSFADNESGGFFVPAEVSTEVIELLKAETVVTKAGARMLTGLTKAPFSISKKTQATTAGWGTELAAIAESQMKGGLLQAMPRRCAALTPISDLLTVLDGNTESIVRQDQAEELALAVDKAALLGDGVPGAEPLGVKNFKNVNTSTLTDPATYDELIDFISKVRGANALRGKLAWIMSNADLTELEKIKDAVSGTSIVVQPLERRRLFSEDGSKLLNFPWFMSTQLSDGDVFFGDWSNEWILMWGGIRFDVSTHVAFKSGDVYLRTTTYADILCRRGESFCVPA